ncbi:helix-turn-helix domain-containing protein [Curtobacterium sp. PhB146]|uniref:helix-turn-helix domain-containing protein n=1 Tax=Curtobacterium sp. PhB146 TaxID=2485187 RepID=UPI0010525962|nr:helix-turn-helix domain-containing protein [Curtobacterium sp. PhB146]TCU42254.1 helix-turn-helix protein [Curtobacterium sp. PhB146]
MSASTGELAAVGIDVGAQKPAVARALVCIEARYRGRLTEPEIAAASGYSKRGLQEAFQRDLGIPPSAVVRLLRLHRARTMILANPYQPVGTAAAASGIPHFGRFSGYYRAQYGETPSDTAHAARARLPV